MISAELQIGGDLCGGLPGGDHYRGLCGKAMGISMNPIKDFRRSGSCPPPEVRHG
jgi:hypothetical protein